MKINISIVSHDHGEWLSPLISDIEKYCSKEDISVILTLNKQERLPFQLEKRSFPITLIQNKKPKGFGSNHNQAFHLETSDIFCIMNPDVRLQENPFPRLCTLVEKENTGVVSPLVLDPNNKIEDNARRLPTPSGLITRNIRGKPDHRLDYPIKSELVFPDWIAGIFMVFPSSLFKKMGGFDERYFLYFEDVDLCSRLRLAGYPVVLDPLVSVTHMARRDSHKNIKHFLWHVRSGVRFFTSPVYFSCLKRKSFKEI